jgi:afadin
LPFLFEIHLDGSEMNNSSRFIIPLNVTEVGTDPAIQSGQCMLLPPGPFLYPRHCVLAHTEAIVTITPSHREAETFVNNQRIFETTILQVNN